MRPHHTLPVALWVEYMPRTKHELKGLAVDLWILLPSMRVPACSYLSHQPETQCLAEEVKHHWESKTWQLSENGAKIDKSLRYPLSTSSPWSFCSTIWLRQTFILIFNLHCQLFEPPHHQPRKDWGIIEGVCRGLPAMCLQVVSCQRAFFLGKPSLMSSL